MKTIKLSQGKVAKVDDCDFAMLSVFKWHFDGRYAGTIQYCYQRGKKTRMHTLILPSRPGFEVDHMNRDSLDNRRANLRYVPHATNIRNRERQRNNTTGFTGVSKVARVGQPRWRATAKVMGKSFHLGVFYSPESASYAYTSFVGRL